MGLRGSKRCRAPQPGCPCRNPCRANKSLYCLSRLMDNPGMAEVRPAPSRHGTPGNLGGWPGQSPSPSAPPPALHYKRGINNPVIRRGWRSECLGCSRMAMPPRMPLGCPPGCPSDPRTLQWEPTQPQILQHQPQGWIEGQTQPLEVPHKYPLRLLGELGKLSQERSLSHVGAPGYLAKIRHLGDAVLMSPAAPIPAGERISRL